MKPRPNVIWNEIYCKRCLLCVEVCPVQVLAFSRDEIMEKERWMRPV
jgi:ferredoxin